jgi:CHAT domain-containing protein
VGVIPHSILHYVPFAALSDGRRMLGAKHELFYLPNASALQFIAQKRKSSGGPLLAMAYGQAEGLPTLQYASAEAESIARIYNTQPLLGAAAAKSALIARASDYSIIHLAAHGQLNTTNPLLSRIVLAADSAGDGFLTVSDVYGLSLTRADLVVLSACRTQVGLLSRGDDVIGLTRAFIYAGSPSVISSLWSVDDQATGLLMTSFYKHLKAGMGKAAALRAAQADTRALYPHPYYWAAFVLTGDAGRSSMPASWRPALLVGAGGGILLALCLAALVRRRKIKRPAAEMSQTTGHRSNPE